MNVSLISSQHQTASSGTESHEVKGAPDHDGDADNQSTGSGAANGPTLNGQGQPIGMHISAKA